SRRSPLRRRLKAARGAPGPGRQPAREAPGRCYGPAPERGAGRLAPGPMERAPRLILLLVLGVLAVARAACGGSDSSADTDQLLKDTFGRKQPVSSGRLALAVNVD